MAQGRPRGECQAVCTKLAHNFARARASQGSRWIGANRLQRRERRQRLRCAAQARRRGACGAASTTQPLRARAASNARLNIVSSRGRHQRTGCLFQEEAFFFLVSGSDQRAGNLNSSARAWKGLGSQSAERGRFALAALTRPGIPELRAAPPLEHVAPAEREETLWGDRAWARAWARARAGAGAGARARARARDRARSRLRARAKGQAWASGRTAHTAKLPSA